MVIKSLNLFLPNSARLVNQNILKATSAASKMNVIWSNVVAVLLANILQGVVAPGGHRDDPINTCKAQYHALYETEWGLDMSFGRPDCVYNCFLKLQGRNGGGGVFWQGCYHESECANCYCTLDSDFITRGYATMQDAEQKIDKATKRRKSWFAERFEGTMYLAYDCRKNSPMAMAYETARSRDSKTGRSRMATSYDRWLQLTQRKR